LAVKGDDCQRALADPPGAAARQPIWRRKALNLEGGDSSMAKVRPLHDRLLVKRIEEKETIKGGIIIPDTAKEKPQEGEVIAVGNGKVLDNGTKLALDVKAGDKILFGKYSGTDIKIDGEEYLILREDEVLAVIG
jgi:chaperonin GroES